jgi:large subunit ribosomal protein L19
MEARKALGLRAGDTVRVWSRITEVDAKGKEKTRLQAFEGLILACKHGTTVGGTYTVRKVSNGFGIERVFPLYSPVVEKIEIVKRAKTRRAKLYHIRRKASREVKRALRRERVVQEVAAKAPAVEAVVEETPATE